MAEPLRGPLEKFVDSSYYSEEDSGTGGFEYTNFSNSPSSWRGGKFQRILNFDTEWSWVVNFTVREMYHGAIDSGVYWRELWGIAGVVWTQQGRDNSTSGKTPQQYFPQLPNSMAQIYRLITVTDILIQYND
jgi:hypothetical protein